MLHTVSRSDDPMTGLTEAEAAARLAQDGPNELPGKDRRNVLAVVVEVLREPMLLMLIVACAIYLALGDLHEAVLIIGLASASILITVLQELRSERVLAALRDLTSPRALVIREGARRRIPGREVVRGDILVLSEGDRVPADALLLTPHQIEVDESLLTGESLPVSKAPKPGAELDMPQVYSGTLIVSGNGIARVTATGAESEIGKIGKSLHGIASEQPPLQQQIRGFVRFFAVLAVTTSVVVAVLYTLLRGGWLEGVLGGLALSMALLPEEFPVVLTVFLVMGAWRISKLRVLTRRASAIETLGSATVLCTDKTGTLTENRMAVAELTNGRECWRAGTAGCLTEPLGALLDAGILASQPNPSDPMEKAFLALGGMLLGGEDPHRRGRMERLYPLTPSFPAMTQVWSSLEENGSADTDDAAAYVVAAKGAPETIASLCQLGDEESRLLHEEAQRMAASGLRVLAVASAAWDKAELPGQQTSFPFTYLGLVGLADPLKPHVPAAVDECREAGIRVVMITGDYPATARAIARQAGIADGHLITGSEIDALDDNTLTERMRGATIFARVRPDQKLRIVNAMKANGEVVAMTGDGVNDAPSLKAAHIGVAMGGRGTDVAREASAIVLLDDDFASIVKTIRLGRRIYDNLQKAMTFVAAAHVPIAGLAFLPLLFGLPLMLLPVHIAFIEMIIDPVSSIAFEAEPAEAGIMKRPPRSIRSQLLSRAVILQSVLHGSAALAVVATVFLTANFVGRPEDTTRSLTFLSLVLANAALILSNRSFDGSIREAIGRSNPTLWAVLGFDALVLCATFTIPQIRQAFSFGPLFWSDVAIVVSFALALVAGLVLASGKLRRTA